MIKIGIIQASSQKEKNKLIFDCTQKAVSGCGHQLVNFGIKESETDSYSYIQTDFLVCLLLESRAVDFMITGCSSGQVGVERSGRVTA